LRVLQFPDGPALSEREITSSMLLSPPQHANRFAERRFVRPNRKPRRLKPTPPRVAPRVSQAPAPLVGYTVLTRVFRAGRWRPNPLARRGILRGCRHVGAVNTTIRRAIEKEVAFAAKRGRCARVERGLTLSRSFFCSSAHPVRVWSIFFCLGYECLLAAEGGGPPLNMRWALHPLLVSAQKKNLARRVASVQVNPARSPTAPVNWQTRTRDHLSVLPGRTQLGPGP